MTWINYGNCYEKNGLSTGFNVFSCNILILSSSNMSWILLTGTDSIPAGSAQEFAVDTNNGLLEIFIVNDNQQMYAYKNQCPHTGVNLNWQPNQFFDIDNRFLQCSTHGALFRTNDGYCVRGPCAGASLVSIPLKIENGSIYFESP